MAWLGKSSTVAIYSQAMIHGGDLDSGRAEVCSPGLYVIYFNLSGLFLSPV